MIRKKEQLKEQKKIIKKCKNTNKEYEYRQLYGPGNKNPKWTRVLKKEVERYDKTDTIKSTDPVTLHESADLCRYPIK